MCPLENGDLINWIGGLKRLDDRIILQMGDLMI
jgi:hypothetical protein